MLKLTPEFMEKFADASIKDMEHGWILKELKNAYGSVLLALDDPFLAGEIKAC